MPAASGTTTSNGARNCACQRTLGELADYQTGLYYLKVHNVADYRRGWGNDAGAWFATTAQYNRLDRAVNADGSVSGGRSLLQNSLDRLLMSFNSPAGVQDIQNESVAAFGQLNWHVADNFTVTTGVRFTHEDRQTTSSTGIKDNGSAPELNPAVVNNVNLGGFFSIANGAFDPVQPNSTAQLQTADLVALKYFGVATTATPGAAYDSLTAAQKQQVADAKAIRQSQIGVVFPTTVGRRLHGYPAGVGSQPELQDQRELLHLRVVATRREGRHLAVRQRHLERGRRPRRPTPTKSASRPCCSMTRWSSTRRCSIRRSRTTSNRCVSSMSTPPP